MTWQEWLAAGITLWVVLACFLGPLIGTAILVLREGEQEMSLRGSEVMDIYFARTRAINAAADHFAGANLEKERLRVIMRNTDYPIIKAAVEKVLRESVAT